ncbi:MAG: nucleotide exchange factor GrpE [Acidimicrobiia bacterium]|nr:nucleotide exchange factor GrpE [Acidimicrobiia bacterium]
MGDDTQADEALDVGAAADDAADAPRREQADIPDLDAIDDSVELREVAGWLREELVATRIDREEHLDHLLRIKAEFDNYRKRMLREQSDVVQRASIRVVEELLPVLDSLDLALDNADEDDPLFPGIAAVRTQILDVLAKEGLDRIAPDGGEAFDPTVHEPVAHVPDDSTDAGQSVTRVLRAGYALKGRLLRAAMVEVKG